VTSSRLPLRPSRMMLVTEAIPSPLTRTALPGVAREMPRQPVRQVMASMTGRDVAADAAAAGAAGAALGAAPPVGEGAWAAAVAGRAAAHSSDATPSHRVGATLRAGDAMPSHRLGAAAGTEDRAGRSTGRLAAYGVS
jgi:hypothetical protein